MKAASVLFVCLGNICRSPTAEGIFQSRVTEAGLGHLIRMDSAGTGDWHVGKKPDARTIAAAKQRGYALDHLRARQVNVDDFSRFDFILAMDDNNLADLRRMQPPQSRADLQLLLSFGRQTEYREVPDPYHGGAAGFTLVLDLVEDACDGLLVALRERR